MSKLPVHVVLVPGYWLGAWAWDGVVRFLEEDGLVAHPVTLPGLTSNGEDRTGLTLADHVAAVRDVVARLDGPVVLVGHSGGAVVAQQVVDADPARISRVVYVDAGPLPDGEAMWPELASDAIDLPLPSWDELAGEGNALTGLDEEMLAELRARAVPQPAGVARSAVRLQNPARTEVPVTIVCCTIPAAEVKDGLEQEAPFVSELVGAKVELVDMPTGHWPMFSRPFDLAEAIIGAARR